MASNNSVEKSSTITTVSTGQGWRGAERDRRLDPMHRLVTGDRVTISGELAPIINKFTGPTTTVMIFNLIKI